MIKNASSCLEDSIAIPRLRPERPEIYPAEANITHTRASLTYFGMLVLRVLRPLLSTPPFLAHVPSVPRCRLPVVNPLVSPSYPGPICLLSLLPSLVADPRPQNGNRGLGVDQGQHR